MNLKNIETAIEFKIWFYPQNCNPKIDGVLSSLKLSSEDGIYNFIQNKMFMTIKPKDKSDNKDLSFYLQKGLVNLCQILEKAPDDSVYMQINFFNGAIIEMDRIEIGIDEKIEKGAKKRGFNARNIGKLAEQMANKFTLNAYSPNGQEKFFLMLSGGASKDDFEADIDEEIKSFSLYSDEMKIPIIKKQITKDNEIYFASKLMPNNNKNKESALRLVKSELVFSDYTTTGEPQAIARGAMAKLLKEENSYLKKWDEYGDEEWKILIANAQKVGRVDFIKTDSIDKGIKIFFEENIVDRLSVGLDIEFTTEEPLYLKEKNITEDDFFKKLDDESKVDSIFSKIKKLEAKSIVIESSDDNKINIEDLKGKFIILSIMGEKVQIERRRDARKRVLSGESENTQLGLLIEEKGEPLPILRVSKMKPLTPFVKNKIFAHDPTSIQTKAIDIALNTPDIALIQGPPGTGKTTVVTAIIERLNEEHDKSNSIRGQILVTGFQHDAVENIISRLSINDLPTIKFGKKSDFSEIGTKQSLKIMIDEIVTTLKNKNPQIKQIKEYAVLESQFATYVTSPSLHQAKTLLELALKLPSSTIKKEQITEINKILKTIIKSDKSSDDNREKIKVIRALRIKEESFLDDGKENASDCMEYFEEDLNEEEQRSLKKAILWKLGKDLSFLNSLKEIKIKLLNSYLPKMEYKREKPRKDILELMKTLSEQLKETTSSADKKERVLSEFLYELENNPLSIEESISDYNYVFSATTQQAEGKDIRRAKKKFNPKKFLSYDTVIVDEAARVSPRDLLIPMVQAKKRIILVGDHRQLPHIIDEEIVKSLESENDENNLKSEDEYIKISMFAYLFNRLKTLESKDNVQRTITLDAQYRMHPLLGKFTSDNFYKEYGEAYRSPLKEECFIQNLSRLNAKSAVWLNVSNNRGEESRDKNKSRYREAEAGAIAKQLKEWIDSKEGEKLTFGVISFYRGQVNAVFDSLEKYGITKNREIVDEYKYLKENSSEERLRIGTVDSFQGMEFDVVFLSMVRSTTQKEINKKLKEIDEEKVAISAFGHLMSKNRLCVSVSRQKKVLVIVGDGDLVNMKFSQKYIPSLYNFYELAKNEGVVLNENS
jgi:superfamily I DNA and/or RNA helicase